MLVAVDESNLVAVVETYAKKISKLAARCAVGLSVVRVRWFDVTKKECTFSRYNLGQVSATIHEPIVSGEQTEHVV